MHIGIFDSGIGGEAIANTVRSHFPDARITIVNDRDNVPYGNKPSYQVKQLTESAIQPLLHAQCDVIVIACNTATAVAIDHLRTTYPHQHFIGLEPMLKPASKLTKTGIITVCATPVTLASTNYNDLKRRYASDITVIEPNCSEWARLIENNTINREEIERVVNESKKAGADVMVLGCTHYHWIKEAIQELAGSSTTILEPSEAVARRIAYLMTTDAQQHP